MIRPARARAARLWPGPGFTKRGAIVTAAVRPGAMVTRVGPVQAKP